MYKTQQGFILLIVLTFFALLSLFISNSIRHILIYHQALTKWELDNQNFYQLEYAMKMLLQGSLSKNCMSNLKEESSLHKLSDKQGCKFLFAKKEYLYQVEDLGIFACLVDKEQRATQHFRITLMSIAKNENSPFLQIRWVKTAMKNEVCEGKKRIINTGVTSWLYAKQASRT